VTTVYLMTWGKIKRAGLTLGLPLAVVTILPITLTIRRADFWHAYAAFYILFGLVLLSGVFLAGRYELRRRRPVDDRQANLMWSGRFPEIEMVPQISYVEAVRPRSAARKPVRERVRLPEFV
jgi:hypothetical protein